MIRVATVYLTRNGLLEPLGQSQVMAYLRGLSRDYAITLITYEKPEDWADAAARARARADCEAHGIRWLPQQFRPSPKIIAPALSMARMIWLVRREVRRGGIRLIHARSYIPAAVALAVSRMTGVPFLFDMRALWPEELITAGRLRRGSTMHRAITKTERACLAGSSGVVSLTHAAVAHLNSVYPRELAEQRLVVIPTCADLDRFRPPAVRKTGARVHSCIGTVLSGWFRTDWLAAWLAAAAARDPQARFDIVTRDDPAKVREALDAGGALAERLTIGPRKPQDMPDTVRGHDLSVMFYAGGQMSELGRSPTRMAEILGTGLPVVANDGVGDVERIIEKYRVGVLVAGPAPGQMASALAALDALMADPDLPIRCRMAAEEVFSLKAGTEAYAALYASVLGQSQKAATCAA
ncbi:glycosyltransferase [Aurantimonas coralicida]|uniref:glycosyltransferase n=1 Tax=Aurantimonas coralicida TaxID=182270 RepID=UPI0035178882